MADDVRCPSCGAAIPPGATAGLCPRCLLRQALHDDESLLAEETTIQSAGSRSQDDHPSTIGPYKILDRLGEGGMGVVYLAEQQQPVQRRVALKVIKRGMDTREVVARFETERQALALMNHPSIAKVFDAGETADGRPYFVMEHVPGEPITEYCDRHRLPNVARLTLLRLVCDAIQHAHQKGVIHRDLKPTNVLVTLQDGRPLPKVIDFGVAKATHQRLTEKSLFTQVGVLIGTPEYMSPEQADLTGLDVDTRTDVYGLGVLLYELLVGVLPFDGQTLRRQAFDEIRRIIREEDPARPSTRVSRSDATTDVLAKRRNTDVGTLRRELRGNLDWITLKALEKDRSRRYGSAAELAADLERHLAHEPVLASPPSTAYHVGKFVRRHRVGVAASAAVVILLVVFGATTAVQAARIAQERDRANQEADTAREVTDFLVGMFELADPSVARGETITALEILARGTERIKSELAGSPELQATLHDAVGRVYGGLQLYDTAEPLLETALETRRRVFGNNSLEVAGTLHNLGRLRLGDHQYADAIAPLREAADIQREVSGQESLDLAANLSGLGHALDYLSDVTGAETTLVWVDRDGREEAVGLEPASYSNFDLSPDGTRVAIRAIGEDPTVWIYDLARRTRTRLVFENELSGFNPIFPRWTPDGTRVAFGTRLSWKRADGSGTVESLDDTPGMIPADFSPDGQRLVFVQINGAGGGGLGVLTLAEERTSSLVLDGEFVEREAAVSPDGRWLAYNSDETGRHEVYVRPFPDVDSGKWQISTDGGEWPVWNPAADELLYRGPTGVMALAFETEPTFTPGAPTQLFERRILGARIREMDVSPDGQRFLFTAVPEGANASEQIIVVQNWFSELERLVPVD